MRSTDIFMAKKRKEQETKMSASLVTLSCLCVHNSVTGCGLRKPSLYPDPAHTK